MELDPKLITSLRPFQRIILQKLIENPSGISYEKFKESCPWFGIGPVVTNRLATELAKYELEIIVRENYQKDYVYKLVKLGTVIKKYNKPPIDKKITNSPPKKTQKKSGNTIKSLTKNQKSIFEALCKNPDGLFLADLENITDVHAAYRKVTVHFLRCLQENGYNFTRKKIGHRTFFKIEKILPDKKLVS